MRQALREIAIVGQDEQSFALRIEPSDVEQTRAVWRQEIENGIARVWVAPGGNEAGRFVEDDVELMLRANDFAADLDVIGRGRLDAEIRANAPVDRDPPGGDQFIAMPARADTSGGEKTVEAQGALRVRLGLRKADDLGAVFPQTALLEQLDALETLQDISFGRDGAGPS